MDNNSVAKNLVMYRKNKNLTQMELAEKINYSDKVISKWERGESLPGIEALKNLADFYEITVDDLISKRDIIKENKKTNLVMMKQVKGASKLFRWSALFLAIVWTITIAMGPEVFVIGGFIFLVYWIIYSLLVVVSEYQGEFDGHSIKVKTSPRGITLFIDDELTDSTGVPFVVNYVLTGKVGNSMVKARVALFFGTKLKVFIE